MKTLLKKIYYWGLSSDADFQKHQRNIRDCEWKSVKSFIPEGSKFLDVGCGTGFSMFRAIKDRNCECIGIDPFPNKAGVRHLMLGLDEANYHLMEDKAENLPCENASMDVIYCSHVLEHVQDEDHALREMTRVLKPDGVLILGVPTATMAWIRLFSIFLFETHRNMIAILSWPFRPSIRKGRRFLDLIIPPSHGQPGKTIFSDLWHYRVSNWKRIMERHFKVEKVLFPALYPFPDYYQLFKMKKMNSISSSVFFICKVRK